MNKTQRTLIMFHSYVLHEVISVTCVTSKQFK